MLLWAVMIAFHEVSESSVGHPERHHAGMSGFTERFLIDSQEGQYVSMPKLPPDQRLPTKTLRWLC
jgi:hypothetical protein